MDNEGCGSKAVEDTESALLEFCKQVSRSKGGQVYMPPGMDDGRDAPKAEEFGVVGSWPVPDKRPEL